jgi:hypothetical protein
MTFELPGSGRSDSPRQSSVTASCVPATLQSWRVDKSSWRLDLSPTQSAQSSHLPMLSLQPLGAGARRSPRACQWP